MIFKDYWTCDVCESGHYGMCYKCGKCGRKFDGQILLNKDEFPSSGEVGGEIKKSMGDQMPKDQYEYIKAIQDDCLECTNMTENEAWNFAFRCWQLGYKKWVEEVKGEL